jgi:CheY-like chemotaxis protein
MYERGPDKAGKGGTPTSLAEIPAGVLEGLHILVVDDQEDSREIVVDILQRYGAKMNSVASASAAIDTLLQQPPNMLIADIGMPGEDGYWLMEKIVLCRRRPVVQFLPWRLPPLPAPKTASAPWR